MGFRKLDEPKENTCLDPEHNPPTMIVLLPGKYEYTCPSCGKKQIIFGKKIVC